MTPTVTARTATVELRIGDTPPCPRCTTPALLLARYPHSWPNRFGQPVDGVKETVLCGSCDTGHPAARGLLALFAEDGRLGAAASAVLGELVHAWLDAVRHRTPDGRELAAQEARWRAGDL